MGLYDLIVFDWDGTLSDSLTAVFHLIDDAKSDHPRTEVGRYLKHNKLLVVLEQMMSNEGIQMSDVRILLNLGECDRIFNDVSMFAGVKELVLSLYAQEQKMAVVSSRLQAQVMAEMQLLGVDHCFFAVMGAGQGPAKPNPAMLKAIMSLAQCAPERTVMVGDALLDLEMAMLAHVRSIAVYYSHAHRVGLDIDRIKLWRPVGIAHTVSELSTLLGCRTPAALQNS